MSGVISPAPLLLPIGSAHSNFRLIGVFAESSVILRRYHIGNG